MSSLHLRFGYNPGIPEDAVAAWGCRAIVDQSGYLDVPWDRSDAVGPDGPRSELLDYLTATVGDAWRTTAAGLLASGRMNTRVGGEHELFNDGTVKVVGNTNGSGGYLYVCAFMIPGLC